MFHEDMLNEVGRQAYRFGGPTPESGGGLCQCFPPVRDCRHQSSMVQSRGGRPKGPSDRATCIDGGRGGFLQAILVALWSQFEPWGRQTGSLRRGASVVPAKRQNGSDSNRSWAERYPYMATVRERQSGPSAKA